MNAKQRLELIRARLGAIDAVVRAELNDPAGMYASQHPEAIRRAFRRLCVAQSLAIHQHARRPQYDSSFGITEPQRRSVEWIEKPDGKHVILLRPRRKRRKSPLTAAAEQEPEKPQRVRKYTWQTADAGTASPADR